MSAAKTETLQNLLTHQQIEEIWRLHEAGKLTIDDLKRICAQDEDGLLRKGVVANYLAYALAAKLGVL